MSLLTQALVKLSEWIEQSDSWHAKAIRETLPPYGLKPGLESELIELYTEEMNLTFSKEIYDLYQWHNGTFILGEWYNPVTFISLDVALIWVKRQISPKLPIFLGDDLFYVVDSATTPDKEHSPIYCYDGWNSDKKEFCSLIAETYAPSLTSLVQAMVECAKVYDGISARYMALDDDPKIDYTERITYYKSLLQPIYAQHGIRSSLGCGLWD